MEDPKYAKAAKQQLKQNASHSRIMNFMSNVLMSLDEAVLSSSNCPPVGNDETGLKEGSLIQMSTTVLPLRDARSLSLDILTRPD